MTKSNSSKRPSSISPETRARNRAFLIFLVVMIVIFYGMGFFRINGGA